MNTPWGGFPTTFIDNMWKIVLDWLRRIVDKRICTVEEFKSACDYALDEVSKDQDGFISVRDAVKLIVKTIWTVRS